MPFDGSGNFNRVMNWVSDAAASVKIRADRHDQEDDNLASGLSNTLTKDGQSQPTANIPMNGKRIVNLGAPVNTTDAATKGSVDTSLDGAIHAAPEKLVPVAADEFAIADSVSTPTAWKRARMTYANVSAAIWAGFTVAAHAFAPKATLVDLDEFTVADSVATPTAWAPKRHSWANLQTMIGITGGQRLAKTQGATPVTALNLAIESGFYVTTNTTVDSPAAEHGYVTVTAFDATSILQEWTSLQEANKRTFARRRTTAGWGAWVETTSINALRKDVDGVIAGAGYTQNSVVDAVTVNAYTPSPAGGNLRQVNPVAVPWTFNAPTMAGNYTMVIRIANNIASGAVTFAGFTKVTGPAHPTAIGKNSLVYITKIEDQKSAFIEAMP